MFQQLHQLAQSCSSLTLLITAGSTTEMTITIIPKSDKDNDEGALATPLQLTATPQELEEGFVGALTSYTDSRGSLAEQVEATKTILESAKKESEKKATKVIAKPAAKGKEVKAADPGGDDDDHTDDEATSSDAATSSTDSDNQSTTAGAGTDNLWG